MDLLELIKEKINDVSKPENLNDAGDVIQGVVIVTIFTIVVMLPAILIWEYLLIALFIVLCCITIFPVVLTILFWDNYSQDIKTFTSNAWIGGVIFTVLVSLYLFRHLWYKVVEGIFYCLNCNECGTVCEDCSECGGRCCKECITEFGGGCRQLCVEIGRNCNECCKGQCKELSKECNNCNGECCKECLEECGYGLNQICIEVSRCCCRCGRKKTKSRIVDFTGIEFNNASIPSTNPPLPYTLPPIDKHTIIFESTKSSN